MTATPTLGSRVAAEVRAEMARQQVSGIALAERSGISPATMSRSLTGARAFDLAELLSIAEALDVPASQFLVRAEAQAAAS